jgi:DNA-binding beta-propeller fold protein YncE
MSVDANGALSSVIQNFTYANGSGAHGAAVSPDNRFLYSADLTGNAVWRHSIEPGTGMLQDEFRLEAPEDSGPRHMSVHSGGKYLYVLMETTSQMAVYSLNGKKLKLRGSYPIYPPGKIPALIIWTPPDIEKAAMSFNSEETQLHYPPARSTYGHQHAQAVLVQHRDTSLVGSWISTAQSRNKWLRCLLRLC